MADPSAPRAGGIPAPYRGPVRVGNLFGASRPADSTDAAYASIAKPLLRHNPPKERAAGGEGSSSNGSSDGLAPAGDAALVGAMAARLKHLEDAHRRLKEELIAKDKEVLKLRRELEDLSVRSEAEAAEAQLEILRLRTQVSDMETFLGDYGLEWVGGVGAKGGEGAGAKVTTGQGGVSSSSRAGSAAAARQPEPANASASRRGSAGATSSAEPPPPAAVTEALERPLDVDIDFPVLFLRLAQLNELAGAGKARVVKTRDGAHKLEVPTGLPLAVYRNGYMLGRGPFRRYDDPVGRAFLQDVLDGYFPSQFEASHPEGVVFEVKNCLGGEDSKNAADGWYRGREYYAELAAAVGGGSATSAKPAGLAGIGPATLPLAGGGNSSTGGARITTLSDGNNNGGAPAAIGVKEFLSCLPPSVVAGPKGSLVPVRAAIEALIGGGGAGSKKEGNGSGAAGGAGGDGLIHVPTYVTEAMEAAAAAGTNGASTPAKPPFDDLVSLRVRGEEGAQTLVIRLRGCDTVGDLRGLVAAYRTRSEPFELRTAYPARAYTDESMTLKAAGLSPSATLLVRTVAAAAPA